MTTVSTTVIALYLAGMLLATALILEVVPRIAADQSIPRSKTYVIIGAFFWPILLVGLIELVSVMFLAKRTQNGAAEDQLLRFAQR